MNGPDVAELEAACEAALAPVAETWFEDLPDHVVHLMAKAAVAVLEAAVDESE